MKQVEGTRFQIYFVQNLERFVLQIHIQLRGFKYIFESCEIDENFNQIKKDKENAWLV